MDGGQPAHVGPTHNRMLALGPCQEVTVLLVAVVDGLVPRALGVYDSNKQYSDFLTWTKGKHTIVGGTNKIGRATCRDRGQPRVAGRARKRKVEGKSEERDENRT